MPDRILAIASIALGAQAVPLALALAQTTGTAGVSFPTTDLGLAGMILAGLGTSGVAIKVLIWLLKQEKAEKAQMLAAEQAEKAKIILAEQEERVRVQAIWEKLASAHTSALREVTAQHALAVEKSSVATARLADKIANMDVRCHGKASKDKEPKPFGD